MPDAKDGASGGPCPGSKDPHPRTRVSLAKVLDEKDVNKELCVLDNDGVSLNPVTFTFLDASLVEFDGDAGVIVGMNEWIQNFSPGLAGEEPTPWFVDCIWRDGFRRGVHPLQAKSIQHNIGGVLVSAVDNGLATAPAKLMVSGRGRRRIDKEQSFLASRLANAARPSTSGSNKDRIGRRGRASRKNDGRYLGGGVRNSCCGARSWWTAPDSTTIGG